MSRTDSQDPDGEGEFEPGTRARSEPGSGPGTVPGREPDPEPGPEHESAAVTLDNLAVPLGASEAHGMLCGLLCSQPSATAKTRWFSELLDAAGLAADSLAARVGDVRALDGWFTATVGAFDDANLAFTPLLPDDEVSLPLRLQALSDFCAGFGYGLGIGVAGRGSRPLPADTAEIIRDFQAIELTDLDGAGDGDEEAAFVELVEYVRVGVLLVHEELRSVSNTSAAASGVASRASGKAMRTPPSSDHKVH